MSMRLDRKLFWSYIVIILIAISTSFTLFTVASNQFLTYRLVDTMKKELSLIEENFGFYSDNSQIAPFITQNIMRLVESNLIIVVDGDTVFTQSNTSK